MSVPTFTTDAGTQEILLRYKTQLASGGTLAQMDAGVLEAGIYEGFDISIVSNVLISIAPGKMIIKSSDYGTSGYNSVRVRTTQTVSNVVVSSGDIYVIARYTWTNQEPSTPVNINPVYVGFGSVTEASLLPTDIILGKCVYTNATLSRIDYSCATLANKWKNETVTDNFKVIQTNPSDMSVTIKIRESDYKNVKNYFSTMSGKHTFTGDQTKSFSAPLNSNESRIDLIYIDPVAGTVAVAEGVATTGTPSAPSYSNRIPLAEINLVNGQTKIAQSDIIDVRNFTPMGDFFVTPSSAPTTDYQVSNKKYVDDTSKSMAIKYALVLG